VANSIFWAGRSWVQLTSRSAGSILMGRNYMPAFWPARWSDPFYFAGVGQLGGTMFADFATASGGTRNPNMISYKTPKAGGFSLLAAVGLGEGGAGRDQGMNVEYAGGPVYGAIGYEKIANGTAALNNNSVLNAALHYDFKFIKPMLYVSRSKTGGGRLSNEYVSLAAAAPLGSGSVKMAVGRFDPAGVNNTQTKLGLGYDYYLSKRTWIYADSGFGREDSKSSNRAYAIGMRHHF
jgi:predicted porin